MPLWKSNKAASVGANWAICRYDDPLARNRVASLARRPPVIHSSASANALAFCSLVYSFRYGLRSAARLSGGDASVGVRLSCDDARRSVVAMSIVLVLWGLGSLVGLKESLCAGVLRGLLVT